MSAFRSVLFPREGLLPAEAIEQPECFVDLNLDQIVSRITAGKEEYDLGAFFHATLHEPADVVWRQEIMRDLEDPRTFEAIKTFERGLREMRKCVAQASKLRFELQAQRWFLDAVRSYAEAVTRLASALSELRLGSHGLIAFRQDIAACVASERYVRLIQRADAIAVQLSGVRYAIQIDGLTVEVRRHEGKPDYSSAVVLTFERFKQGTGKGHAFQFEDRTEMNSVEEKILATVARVFPELFHELDEFCEANRDFADEGILRFDREIQFYVAVLEHVARLRRAGVAFCYPRVTRETKEVYDYAGFDLALADKLVSEGRVIVPNDFHLSRRERILVVTGPNQGGKTTFARAFGQLHYLASLGLPVAGTRAQVFLPDRVFTHFERGENVKDLRGKLEDDVLRIHSILERATPNSIVVLNEIFTSTTLRDALALSRKVAARILELDLLCVWVTFLDEIAALGDATVSMVSTVEPSDPAIRTFRIVRAPANGLAYAMSLAERHRLTYRLIKERLGV
jgi:DNA mismatch repair ATPase MutS